MSTDFEIHPESLQAAADRMRGCGDDLLTALEALRAGVEQAGSRWGADEAGTRFAELYTAACTAGFESIGQLGGHLADVASGLERWARNTVAADDSNTAALEQVGGTQVLGG